VAGVALIAGFLVVIFGLLADRLGDNRRLLDEILYRMRKEELKVPDDKKVGRG
jgi:hypothetical protein